MVPPPGIASRALIARFRMTSSIWLGSASANERRSEVRSHEARRWSRINDRDPQVPHGSLLTPCWREMDSNYWYRVRVLLGLREVRSSRGDICKPGRHLRMQTKPFAIIAVCACVEHRLAAHDALDGPTSRTLREPASD